MKVLVTGANGQLGREVVQYLNGKIEVSALTRANLDVTDRQAVCDCLRSYRPDAVVHCAAYTAVDKAEEEREQCLAVNGTGTAYMAEACNRIGALLLYPSTDYVFNGSGTQLWETDSPTEPLNVYGTSKLLGEEAAKTAKRHIILRISWVFGVYGSNFAATMLRLAQIRDQLGVVADQIGSPTATEDLAPLIYEMLLHDTQGIFHATNEGFCSWYDYARHIFACAHQKVAVEPLTTAQYPAPALRPLNSRLSKASLDRAGLHRLPPWQDAVERYLSRSSAP